jgi:hypothetical protein
VPCEPPICCLLLSTIEQTLEVHYQASQPYQYTNADICAIACFVLASVSFNQHAVNLAFIEQTCSGLCPTKHENRLAFYHQVEETQAHCAANAKCKEAHKKSLAVCLKVSLADHFASIASTSATSIAPKPILINFKKIQGEDCIKVF